jgi:hypothetical protein
MANNVAPNWEQEFGISDRRPPRFFASTNELTNEIPQAHVLRRAFELFELDGVLCLENSPLIYFKQIDRITTDRAVQMHRQFWNHGGAPILVLIAADNVHIYSGLSRPEADTNANASLSSLVKTLDRISDGLKEFVVSVETGEFFQKNSKFFNPDHRVDRDLLNNLKDTRDLLDDITKREISPSVLDALLCRLVFTCYLFDREVIGENYLKKAKIRGASHLRDILSIQPVKDAKNALYKLFNRLEFDFNGDLFNDDLETEANRVTHKHIQILSNFFNGISVRSGQRSFWPYDFGVIPIETISAIYEHFLKTEDHDSGAFYTPRFLAEVVLDTALEGVTTVGSSKFLDPACGSGIFLVGLFNRIAEEWTQANPTATNDRRAKELMRLLQSNLFGIDINPTACRITAFSLYLAYLDQLTPRDIQHLQSKGRALPGLVRKDSSSRNPVQTGNIQCIDFFSSNIDVPNDINFIIGNPPWGSIATQETVAGKWCSINGKALPDKQISAAFIWKSATHITSGGKICLVLPHGTLFNHNSTAISFQKSWLDQHTLLTVLNLADYRWFLFEKAVHPALVIRYKNEKPSSQRQVIEYLAPKADWAVTKADIISIAAIDRSEIVIRDILKDLEGPDGPQTWKQRFWATPRDLRLLDRLSLYPRLRDHVRSSREANERKPWIMAEGFQPLGPKDKAEIAQTLKLPSKQFIQAKSVDIDLFLLPTDTKTLKSSSITVRSRSNKNTKIFLAPHVLITKGFQRIAFADFDVSFQHALRGIHGPADQRNLLIFLSAYLRTSLAKYFMFHTSSSWGMYRPEGHVEEVLRLPFPFPAQMKDEKSSNKIVKEVVRIVEDASKKSIENFLARPSLVQNASAEIETLMENYFDLQAVEKILIKDTVNVIIPSIQPSHRRMPVPTLKHTNVIQQKVYLQRVCETLNSWAKNESTVHGYTNVSSDLGLGLVVLEKVNKGQSYNQPSNNDNDLMTSLVRIREIVSRKKTSINPIQGVMAFDKKNLYIIKPIGQRNWTETAGLNDADEIAGSILMHSHTEHT